MRSLFAESIAPISFRRWPFNIISSSKSCVWEAGRAYRYSSSWCTSWHLWLLWRKQVFTRFFFCSNHGGWLCSPPFTGTTFLYSWIWMLMWKEFRGRNFNPLSYWWVNLGYVLSLTGQMGQKSLKWFFMHNFYSF